MRGRLLVALATTAAALAPIGTAAAPAKCEQAEPVFAYDAAEVSYSLSVELRGCSWVTRRRPLVVGGSITRDGGAGARTEAGFATCDRRGACRLVLGMEHLPVEAARYTAEITLRWNRKEVRHEVDKLCVAAAAGGQCADL
ncbi:MAG TPA: hypothetical protein VM573_04805 [Actinomycetota bacterium]|nr:hypothetical protein [Actinomycetota bacterium]